ncbi:ABC transporter permease [Carnobacterium gallinarum]|uniref:ABC transporter permease n=1 Tax=Carnobacterium gallinarum TaxID=2749 RepID=UPI00054FDB44|nr:ABC transporter permease [Carnobacterium gallinarum]
MLLKLSLSGIKSKLKDYIVLLIGLVMSSSIFYMFQTLAMNQTFLEKNSMIRMLSFVFLAGSILLGIITVVYILYANSFLLSLRQKEYGMYMTLGAKKKKISKMMFIETMIVGVTSLVIGIVVGIFLAQLVASLLMQQLDFSSPEFSPIYLPAILTTIIFFLVLFVLAAFINVIKLARLSVLDLIHGEKQANHIVINKNRMILQSFISFILLTIGYLAMINIIKFQLLGIGVALVTITGGTFLFFKTFLPYLIHKLKENRRISEKKITIFTLSQLSFRVNDLTKILAVVTMLIALAVGSISVGIGFKNNIGIMMKSSAPFDLTVRNPTKEQETEIAKIKFNSKQVYRYKIDGQMQYFIQEELAKKPLKQRKDGMPEAGKPNFSTVTDKLEAGTVLKTEDSYQNPWVNAFSQVRDDHIDYGKDLPIKIVTEAEFAQISSEENKLVVGDTIDFMKFLPELKQIDRIEKAREPKVDMLTTKYEAYNIWNTLSSGTVFMGLFLGFAFLAMMASCLMFKVLTGAANDISRYEMLSKIGVRRSLLIRSIYKEMFTIFAFPAILGVIHVLFGMQMFKTLLFSPYYRIWIPFLIFVVIYAIYYLITVYLYKGIVLKKVKK